MWVKFDIPLENISFIRCHHFHCRAAKFRLLLSKYGIKQGEILFVSHLLWNRPCFSQVIGNKTYGIGRNFSEDLILALLARLFSSLKLCMAKNTFRLDTMCFMRNLSKMAKISLAKI